MNRSRTAALVVVAVALVALPAAAETEADADANATPWYSRVMVYGWVPVSAAANITLGQDSVSMQASTADLVKALEFTAAIRGEFWYARKMGLLVDLFYVMTGGEASVGQADFTLEVSQALGEAAFAYRLATWPTSSDARAMTIAADLYAGVRISRFKIDLDVNSTSHSRTNTLVDPIIGMRVPVQLAPSWQLVVRGDVGGFGIDSDLIWDVEFGFEHDVSSTIGIELGYRIMDIVFSADAGNATQQASVKSLTHGPAIGASLAF